VRAISLALVAALLAWALPASACNDHAPGTEPKPRAAAQQSSFASGEVREVDLDEATITLAHGAIAGLRMQPMTSMVFKAANAKAIAGLKPGDKVRFRAKVVGEQPTVTEVRLAKK
jgi:Cu/Ag efflux protein CusF